MKTLIWKEPSLGPIWVSQISLRMVLYIAQENTTIYYRKVLWVDSYRNALAVLKNISYRHMKMYFPIYSFFFKKDFFWCGQFFKSLLNLLRYCFRFMFWFFGCEACGILAPQPGIESRPPALEGEVLTTGPPGKSPIYSSSCNNS